LSQFNFKIQESDSAWKRKKVSKTLRGKLSGEGQSSIKKKLEIHVIVPDPADHRNHLIGEVIK
jgi:hypothetical protein